MEAGISETHLIPVTTNISLQPNIVCVRVTVSLSQPTLGVINVNLISTKSIFSIGDEEFQIHFELFLLTLCLYFVLEGNKNVWPKIGVFYQTIFYASI